MKLTPLSLLLLLSLSPAASSSAEPLAFSELSASPSFGIPADLTVSPGIYGENLNSIQYLNGVLSCPLEAPRVGESESCPALGLKVVVKEHLEVSGELATFLSEPREGGDETESRRFWLGPDWILHYMPVSTDFRKPIEQYFLPGTQVRVRIPLNLITRSTPIRSPVPLQFDRLFQGNPIRWPKAMGFSVLVVEDQSFSCLEI